MTSKIPFLTTSELLKNSGVSVWKLEYLTKVEPDAVADLVADTIPPKSRLWIPEAPERLATMAAARSYGPRSC